MRPARGYGSPESEPGVLKSPPVTTDPHPPLPPQQAIAAIFGWGGVAADLCARASEIHTKVWEVRLMDRLRPGPRPRSYAGGEGRGGGGVEAGVRRSCRRRPLPRVRPAGLGMHGIPAVRSGAGRFVQAPRGPPLRGTVQVQTRPPERFQRA